MRLYKIVSAASWAAAERAGVFDGAEIDRADGYIHFSTAAQTAETARRHFTGRTDLVLVAFLAQPFEDALRWEPSRGGDLFPHLYAALDPRAAVEVRALSLNAEGWPDPGEMAA